MDPLVPFATTISFSPLTLMGPSLCGRVRDLYINNVFGSFSQLSDKFSLPDSHLFRYFQVRNWLKLNNPSFPNIPPDSIIDSILDTLTTEKGLVSRIYNSISRLTETSLGKIKQDWEDELVQAIDDDVWDGTLARVNNSTSCARLNLIQLKVVHRIDYTNSKLSKNIP